MNYEDDDDNGNEGRRVVAGDVRRRAAASTPRRLLVERFTLSFFCLRQSDVLESKQLERNYRVQKTFYETRLVKEIVKNYIILLPFAPSSALSPPFPLAVMRGK